MNMKKKVFSLILIGVFAITLNSCEIANDPGDEIMDINGKFNDTKYSTADGSTGTISIDNMIDDNSNNYILREYLSLSFFPKKDIAQDYFSAFGFTLYSENYYGEAIVKFTIEDEVVIYEEKEITEIVNGEEVTRIEMVEISREIETIELTEPGGHKIRFNGTIGINYGIDLDYEIKTYSSSTCFKMQVYMLDGETPIDFKWAMDNVEILIISHNSTVE